MASLSPHDALAALRAFGRRLPTTASRAVCAGGGAPVFSGAVAPGAFEGRIRGGLPIPARDDAWEERAALLEFDGGWPRTMAETIADRLIAMEAGGAGSQAWAAFDAELITLERQRPPSRDIGIRPGEPAPPRVPPRLKGIAADKGANSI